MDLKERMVIFMIIPLKNKFLMVVNFNVVILSVLIYWICLFVFIKYFLSHISYFIFLFLITFSHQLLYLSLIKLHFWGFKSFLISFHLTFSNSILSFSVLHYIYSSSLQFHSSYKCFVICKLQPFFPFHFIITSLLQMQFKKQYFSMFLINLLYFLIQLIK